MDPRERSKRAWDGWTVEELERELAPWEGDDNPARMNRAAVYLRALGAALDAGDVGAARALVDQALAMLDGERPF
jgi:hypothetical protein